MVIPLDAGWSDVGSWSSLHEALPQDAQGNVLHGDVLAEDTHGCYVHADSRLVATVGLADCVVVETKDAVLVAPRSRVQDVKKVVARLKQAGRGEHQLHREVYRPWGSYDGIDAGERFQVKRIVVRPGATLSLQMHHHRAEHWIVVSGTARITRNDEVFLLEENQSTYIPVGARHRIENPGKITLHMIEVQSGSYLGEDDIVRFEDLYGREGTGKNVQSMIADRRARPNFMKIAPLYHALAREPWCRVSIVHTGQHYDPNMSDAFFRDLRLPAPHFHLEVGSGSHAEQTGGVMIAYEKVAVAERPDWIVVVGDVNSTAACAMVGTKLWIPVIHLEAGLRSRDRRMPEEINRLVTDAIADVLWTPSRDADANLAAEGVAPERIECIGNIMIDSYEMMREAIDAAGTRASLGLAGNRYGVVTLHRPSNVDSADVLGALVDVLLQASSRLPLVFAVHPRTRKTPARLRAL